MKNRAQSTTLKTFLAILLSLTFLLSPRMLISSAQPPADALKLRSESQLKTEAGLYDTALREINRVATMRLDTVEDLKAVNAILDKQFRNLKYNRSKLTVMGLNDATFLAAVKERMRDSVTTNAFANELAQDPNAILKLSGAASLGDRIVRSVEADAGLVRRVAERIKKAAESIKAKINQNHLTGPKPLRTELNEDETSGVIPSFTPDFKGREAVLLVGVVVIAFPAVGSVLLANAVAAFLLLSLARNLTNEEDKEELKQCNAKNLAKYEACLEETKNLCCGLSFVAGTICLAEFALKAAECLVS